MAVHIESTFDNIALNIADRPRYTRRKLNSPENFRQKVCPTLPQPRPLLNSQVRCNKIRGNSKKELVITQ